ncbi:MAG TPA: diacylglycerol kinase family protein [Patescibacteria group bacterium]|nr:diacylglycerol kinase family protein [Patescibacteria group bacterium]
MRERIKRHQVSFQNAFSGLWYALSTQPNFTIHFLAATLVLVFAYILRLSYIEIVLLVFTILFVLCAELINTALESMVDLITTEWKQQAKVAKDVSAAMVLLTALGSILIGILIFGSHL